MANNNGVEVISTKGCARLFIGTRPQTFCTVGSSEMMSSTTSSVVLLGPTNRETNGPFSGLVICVTGLSKEARNQVMEATERLGGQYSGSLHPKCTHLVVQSFGGRKYDHAIKHGARNGLFVVTLGWFVDSVRKNVRLNESSYSVRSLGENESPLGELNRLTVLPGSERSCLPLAVIDEAKSSKREFDSIRHTFSDDDAIYIDPHISDETKNKIADAVNREGAKLLDHWFIGSKANYVICEGPSIQTYIAHSNNIVTPLWVLKTVKEKRFQRLVHLSSDLAKHVAITLENTRLSKEDAGNRTTSPFPSSFTKISPLNGNEKESIEDRKKIAELAKQGVRDRRSRRMQLCQGPINPITPTILLDSICWSISEPTSSACAYTDSSLSEEAASEQHTPPVHDSNGELLKDPDLLSRPLKESERSEVVFKNHLITILFPIDRFEELGPTSRTFFSNGGFTCIQLLDHIYNFYQENMSDLEIKAAIHTDSRHADRLRSLYVSSESVLFKRADFIGSRRSFESLKRISGETNCNVYQLLVRA